MTNPADSLVDLLDLERIEVNIFRGRSPEESLQRVFGGQVAGQALVAAGRTTDGDRPVHSLHAYFLRPGRPGVPIVYDVERVRDGRSFTTRRVTAVQQGRTIFNLTASFHRPEEAASSTSCRRPASCPIRTSCRPSRTRCVSTWAVCRRLWSGWPGASPSTSATSTGCAGRRRRSRTRTRGARCGCVRSARWVTTRSSTRAR